MAAFAFVLAAALACVWVVPGLLDWNRYRDGIAALVSQRLGRGVRIGGPVSLQLLPQPVLTAANVSVEDAGDGIQLQAKALRLRVALGPLLAGRVDARELVLQGADARLPWPPPAGMFSHPPPAWITGLKAAVEDGRITIGGLVFAGINATLATDPVTRTLSVAGAGQSGGREWQFTVRLARAGRDHAAGLDISLDGQGKLRGTGGTFSGRITPDGAVEGRVAGRGSDLSQLMPAPALPWRGDGRLNAAGGLVIADELSLEIGKAPARGAVALRVTPQARLDVSIAAGRLDLDAWLPPLLLNGPPGLRAGLPTGIDLSAEAATLAGGTLRHLRGAVDLGRDGVALRDISALLPGDARLMLSGKVSDGAPATFAGPVRLTAPDLRATLRWLQPSLPAGIGALPLGVLRTADLMAQVKASAREAALSDLHGSLDGSRLKGTASVRLPAAADRTSASGQPTVPSAAASLAAPAKVPGRMAINADLSLDQLALDAWMPGPGERLAVDAGRQALASLRAVDADLRLQVGRAAWGRAPFGAVAAELQTEAARVFLRRMEAHPLGSQLAVSGQVDRAGRLVDGRVELTTPEAEAFRPLLAALPALPSQLGRLLRGPATATVLVSGPPEALQGKVTFDLSDLRANLQPLVNVPARSWSGSITLHHPGAPRLLQTLGLPATAAWLGDGSFSLVGQAAGEPGKLTLNGATLAAGAFRGVGSLQLDGRRLTGQAMVETLPLPFIYPRSPDPLPLALLRGWQASVRIEAEQVLAGLTPVLQQASTDVTLDDGVLRLNRLAGRLLNGSMTGALEVNAAKDPPRMTLQTQATGLRIPGEATGGPIDVTSGEANLQARLAAEGYSPAALLATLSGNAEFVVKDGVASGFDVAALSAALSAQGVEGRTNLVESSLLAGQTPFSALEMRLGVERGVANVDGRLQGPSGGGTISGSIDLVGDAVDVRLGLSPAPGPAGGAGPNLGLRLSGSATEPVRTPELAGLAQWLADRAARAAAR